MKTMGRREFIKEAMEVPPEPRKRVTWTLRFWTGGSSCVESLCRRKESLVTGNQLGLHGSRAFRGVRMAGS